MIKELIKAVILILFLLAVMLMVGSCGTRRMNQSKDIERVKVQSTAMENEHSTLSSSVRMLEAREATNESNEVFDNETVQENYCIGPDGKPYLCSKTTTKNKGNKNTKGSEKSESAKDETSDQAIDSRKKKELDLDLIDKNKQKQTESDNTIKANFGIIGIIAGIIGIIGTLFFLAFKKATR